MKTPLLRLLLFIWMTAPLAGYTQFSDDFTDGDFTNNPTWAGEDSIFEVDGSNQLHLNAWPITGEAYLSTPSVAIDTAEWSFFVFLDFNPSSSNRARVYLTSSSDNLEGPLNGYFVQIGNTEDEVSLYKQTGTSVEKIIDGVDDLVDESEVEIDVRVTRSTDGNWELFADTSLSNNFVSMGAVTDTTHDSSSYFGVYCDYTATRSDKFYFDNFSVTGNAYLDTEPPSVLSVTPIDATTLTVLFNEPVDPTSATDATNYSVDSGIGVPASATLENDSLVELTLSNAMSQGSDYNLTVSDVEDMSGNAMVSETTPFTFFAFDTPEYKDIVINEIFADPTPPVGLPELEYIEILNVSTKTIDLSQLEFSDASSNGSAIDFGFISPNEYAILCDKDDTTSFQPFGKVVALSSLPALNNSGDVISLRINSTLIDGLAYSNDWYDDPEKDDGGYSLELVNPVTPCGGATNWRASVHPDGGTPGAQNSVYSTSPDTVRPQVTYTSVFSLTEIIVGFDKPLDSASMVGASYTLNQGVTVTSVQTAPTLESVLLSLSSPIDSGLSYTLTISLAEDCLGNQLIPYTGVIGLGKAPKPFDLVITELYPSPEEGGAIPDQEFVEIYNRSGHLIRLEGVQIADASSSSQLYYSILPADSFAIICNDDYESEFEAFGQVIPVSTLPSLNNSGDIISLTKGNQILDLVDYTDDWYGNADKSGGGYSLERSAPNELCGQSRIWKASSHPDGATPGQVNSSFDLDQSSDGASILSAYFTSLDELEVVFDQRMDTTAQAVIHVGSERQSVSFHSFSSVSFQKLDSFNRGTSYSVWVDSATNCVGQPMLEGSIDVYLHDHGDVLLNEVLSNPRGSGTDFVEVINTSAYDVNLSNWSFGYLDNDDSLQTKALDLNDLMDAGSYLVFHEDSADLVSNYGSAATEAFVLTDLPSYSNDEGTVLLLDQFGDTMDLFNYSEDMHFALIDDLNGVSLERLSTSLPTNRASNWHSASSSVNYGTPGYENSQDYQSSSPKNKFALNAEYISPDNDGYQDVVFIDYTFSEQGWLASAYVYNQSGVLIKTITTNELLGNEGSFSWDGTNDLGEKAATGMHLILVEAFNLEGEKTRYRLPIVVAAKL